MAARFEPPVISDNPTGWGPSTIPAQFKDMVRVKSVAVWIIFGSFLTTVPPLQPYQPFSKSDRLGKVSDWTGATYQDRRWANYLWLAWESFTADTATSNLMYFHDSKEKQERRLICESGTWPSTKASMEQEEPSTLTTTRRMILPSNW